MTDIWYLVLYIRISLITAKYWWKYMDLCNLRVLTPYSSKVIQACTVIVYSFPTLPPDGVRPGSNMFYCLITIIKYWNVSKLLANLVIRMGKEIHCAFDQVFGHTYHRWTPLKGDVRWWFGCMDRGSHSWYASHSYLWIYWLAATRSHLKHVPMVSRIIRGPCKLWAFVC